MEIRAGRPDEIDVLLDVEARAAQMFLDTPHAVLVSDIDEDPVWREALRAALARGDVLVVEGEGAVIGYACVRGVDGEGHLKEMDVVPEATGQGVGSALLEAACAHLHAKGYERVTLTTFTDVAFNAPFYEKRGFRPMSVDEIGPELAEILRLESESGLDADKRCAMIREQ